MSRNDLVGEGVEFERMGRITGYASRIKRWNSAKQEEKHDRVMHNQCIPNGDGHVCSCASGG